MFDTMKRALTAIATVVGMCACADSAVPFPSPDTELNDVDPRIPLGRYVQYEASNTVVNTIVLTNGVITVGDSSVNISFTSSNTQLVSTIQAVAPAPGNYSAVSNRAMSAIQSLEPSTNYTDNATNAVYQLGSPYLVPWDYNHAHPPVGEAMTYDGYKEVGDGFLMYLGITGYSTWYFPDVVEVTNIARTASMSVVAPAAAAATNYTDSVASEFENGGRTVESATYSSIAGGLYDDDGMDVYSATALLVASTNAAVAETSAFSNNVYKVLSSLRPDMITDGTNTLSSNLDYEYEKVLTNTWVVNGIPYTTTTGYTYCSYFPPNPNENDIGYTLILNEGSSWESGYYDLSIGTSYWRNQGTEEDPDYQWVSDSGGMTGLLPANGTSFDIDGFVGTYPIKRMETSKLALTNDIPPAVQVVTPSTNAVKGTAADAKATGTALYTGFTEWECTPSELYGKKLHVVYGNGEWFLYADNQFLDPPETADDYVTSLTFSVYDVTATRHLITPTKTSQLTNDSGFLTAHQDISGKLDGVAAYPAWDASRADYLDGEVVSWHGKLWKADGDILDQVGPPDGEGAAYWDETTLDALKQDALSQSQLGAVNSGATSEKVATWDGYSALISQKASLTDLPYDLVEPGEWEFSGVPSGYLIISQPFWNGYYYDVAWQTEDGSDGGDTPLVYNGSFAPHDATYATCTIGGATVTATFKIVLLNRSVNNVTVSTPTSLLFPSNIIGKSSDFYLYLVVSNETQLSVSFLDSDNNPISWVEAPPQNFDVGTNIIHIVEVSENIYSFSKIGTSDSGELTNVRIKGTLSQGHTSAIATGAFSNSQGTNTIAIGVASHAEGASTTAEGNYAHSEGNGTYARGVASHSEGLFTRATERAAHSSGACALATNSWSFVWSGLERSPYYGSHGVSSFNVNPINGINGFYIGEQTLQQAIVASIMDTSVSNDIEVVYQNQDNSDAAMISDIVVTQAVTNHVPTIRTAVRDVVDNAIGNGMVNVTNHYSDWFFTGLPSGVTVTSLQYRNNQWAIQLSNGDHQSMNGDGENSTSLLFLSSEWMEGTETGDVTAYRFFQLQDRSMNILTTWGLTVPLSFPKPVPNKFREFRLRLVITAQPSSADYLNLHGAITNGVEETISFETDDGTFPSVTTISTNLYHFVETAPSIFYVEKKQLTPAPLF